MTFTKKIERAAREGYEEVILPSLKESAEEIASEGLMRLLEESGGNGLTTNIVLVDYDSDDGYSDSFHRATLARLIRKRVFIDVRVDKVSVGYTFELAPFYSRNTGDRGYSEPLYRVQRRERKGLYVNANYLRKKNVKGLRCLVFLKVCEFFNITERYTDFISGYKRPKGLESYYILDHLNLVEVLFIYMQKHPRKILDLHESGDPAKVYDQLNFRSQDSGNSWTDETRAGCVAQLGELLK